MSEEFKSIMEGLNDAIEYTRGNSTKARIRLVKKGGTQVTLSNARGEGNMK